MSVYIVGDIGINHNGDINIVKKLIDISSAAGLNAVKFQKRNPDMCVPEHQKNIRRDTPWGNITYLEYKKKVEFEKKEYDIIDNHCKERNVEWSASPWDLDSCKFLKQYNLPWIKISSASITQEDILRYCGENFSKVVMSTGMSTELEIDNAYNILKLCGCDITVLHCNSSYPVKLKDLNLSYIKILQQKYPNVGYSGHEYGLIPTISTVLYGISFIERHITLDKNMWGSDHSASVEPQGIFKMVRSIRELEMSIGIPEKIITDDEVSIRKKLRG